MFKLILLTTLDKSFGLNQLMIVENKKKKKSDIEPENKELPMGLFFWEASNSLKRFIRRSLNEM